MRTKHYNTEVHHNFRGVHTHTQQMEWLLPYVQGDNLTHFDEFAKKNMCVGIELMAASRDASILLSPLSFCNCVAK